MYVLNSMFVTFPTSHVERSPLKAAAPANTAPHIATTKKRPMIKWLKKREGESSVQKQNQRCKKEEKKETAKKKTRSWRRRGRVHVLLSMVFTCPTSQAEMFALNVALWAKACDISVTNDVFQS